MVFHHCTWTSKLVASDVTHNQNCLTCLWYHLFFWLANQCGFREYAKNKSGWLERSSMENTATSNLLNSLCKKNTHGFITISWLFKVALSFVGDLKTLEIHCNLSHLQTSGVHVTSSKTNQLYQTYLCVSKTTSLALRGSGIGFKLLPVELRQELNRPMPLRRLFAVANDCSKGYHCSFQTIWCSQHVQTLQPLRAFFTARENRIAKNHILSTTCQPPFFPDGQPLPRRRCAPKNWLDKFLPQDARHIYIYIAGSQSCSNWRYCIESKEDSLFAKYILIQP